MKIIVTGSSGFLGRNLVELLERNDHEVVNLYGRNKVEDGVQLDLLDFEKVESLVDNLKPDVVIHAAACCNVADVSKDPERARRFELIVSSYSDFSG